MFICDNCDEATHHSYEIVLTYYDNYGKHVRVYFCSVVCLHSYILEKMEV